MIVLPHQLGYCGGIPDYSGSFETPADADTASIPVMPGKAAPSLLHTNTSVMVTSIVPHIQGTSSCWPRTGCSTTWTWMKLFGK